MDFKKITERIESIKIGKAKKDAEKEMLGVRLSELREQLKELGIVDSPTDLPALKERLTLLSGEIEAKLSTAEQMLKSAE